MVKYLINERYDVEDAEASTAFSKGEKREDYADAWKDTGNVVFVGLPGSGKAELAQLVSERTGMEVDVPISTSEAIDALGGSGRIIILTDDLVEDAQVQPLIHGSGKVFYLLADTRLLSDRVSKRKGEGEADDLWRSLSARLAVMEPVFYSVLHFILQGAQSPEELLSDALEKIGY